MNALSSSVVERLESRVLLVASPMGMTPAMVRTAYGFDKIVFHVGGQAIPGDGSGQTIAIVTAYDDPRIAHDLRVFDAAFGLSNRDSTGRFALTKAIPASGTRVDRSWAQETALDVEWAHAIAPGAHILLVEARSSSLGDLMTAVDFARQQSGVVAVSMSWDSNEFPSETSLDVHMTTPANHIGGGGLLGGATQTLPALFSRPRHDFFDIVKGSSGVNAAAVGFDLVTGLGSPKAWNVATDLLAPGARAAAVPAITTGPVTTALPAMTLTGPAQPFSFVALVRPGALPLENLPAVWGQSMAARFSDRQLLLDAELLA